MKLFCLAIECKNKHEKDVNDIKINHFFANDKDHMEDRVYETIKTLKDDGIETIKHIVFEVDKVDNLNLNKLFNIFNCL